MTVKFVNADDHSLTREKAGQDSKYQRAFENEGPWGIGHEPEVPRAARSARMKYRNE